jgi:hypothetical protein
MEHMEGANAAAAAPKQYPAIDKLCLGLKEFLRALEPPPEAARHFRNARIEALKGIRELIDTRIENLSRSPGKGETITLE